MNKVSAPSASPRKDGKKEVAKAMAARDNTSGTKENKILVAYFSHSGNTRVIAQQIHASLGGDLFEIVPVDSYPRDYDAAVEQARKELSTAYKPKLKTKVQNMKSHTVVCVGYPCWWGTIPRPVATFLSEYDFSGETIAPFCTHEGSGLGRSVTDIRALCPHSTVLNGLAVRGGHVKKAQNEVYGWLREIGLEK